MRKTIAALCASMVAATSAGAKERVTIDYALPATTVTAGVSQRITRCPAPAEEQWKLNEGDAGLRIEFAYKVVVAGKLAPRRLVKLDAETGFLVDRETKVLFTDDWYLNAFNGKTTGQGGPLLVSLVKAGTAIAAMSANPILGVGAAAAATRPNDFSAQLDRPQPSRPRFYAARWYLECSPDTVKALATFDQRREEVGELEGRVAAGDGSSAVQDLLARRRTQVGDIEASLTVRATLRGGLTPTQNADGSITGLSAQIPAKDITGWFRVTRVRKEVRERRLATDEPKPTVGERLAARAREIPGLNGYQVAVAPDPKLLSWFGCDPKARATTSCAADVADTEPLSTRDLVYLRPIPASGSIWPNPKVCPDGTACSADDGWREGKAASGSADVKLPQLSRLHTMRTGGSIFGGRTVGAEFGPAGEPIMLQYNIGSSSKDVAGVIDAGVGGAQTIRDADGAATKRRLEQLKNARDLQDLLDELDDSAD